ncbi:MAG: hypothetical protein IJU45_01210 [Clostridia bacterium]|nr:hypothetical protein [Clostridia bacterium]
MKKLISLVLCTVIALSISITAFAAPKAVTPGTVQGVMLNKGEAAQYTFTASESAAYKVTYKALNKSWTDFLLQCEKEEFGGVTMNLYYDNNSDTQVSEDYFTTCKGYRYNISISNDFDWLDETDRKELGVSDTARVEFLIEKVTLPEVELSGTYTVKGTVEDFILANKYYFMEPLESGYYNFYSQSDESIVPQLEVLSDECESHFGGGYHKAFDVTVYMEKGHLYLIDVYAFIADYENRDLDAEAQTFDAEFTFSIKDGNNIPVESITAYEEKISIQRNWYDIGYCFISPSGFTPFDADEITVTSSNPWVADTCNTYLFQNEVSFEIDAYHFGRTTITVTLPNGMSTSMKVYVKPRIIIMLEDFFATFFGW